jgi:hypothetical protein
LNAKTHAFFATLTHNLHSRDGIASYRKEGLVERNMGQVEDMSPDGLEALLDISDDR